MTKRFYSKVSVWISLTVWGTALMSCTLCIPIFVSSGSLVMKVFALLILITTIALLLAIFFNTYYTIENGLLRWVTGPFKGKIDIASIREITRPKSLMDVSGMMKPVLSSKMLLIKYNKYDDMPFSPLEEVEFLEQLKRENPDISDKT